MVRMPCHQEIIELSGTAETDIHDLTPQARAACSASGLKNGLLTVHAPGSTAGVTTIEFESGALSDLRRVLEELAPAQGHYEHNARWGDGNGYSHVRAALMGPSLSVPVMDGELVLGTWQQIVLLDFDNRPRRRRVIIQLMGE